MTVPFAPPPLPEHTVWAEFLDLNLNPNGLIPYATITATLYYNAVGSWQIVLPYSDAVWNQIMAGDFLVRISWRGLFTFGGKCEQPSYTDSIPGATSGGSIAGSIAGPFIILSGADYTAILANRICFPDPTKAWTAQLPASADAVVNTPLETAIKHYVAWNAGVSALSSRQHPLLDIATDQHRGPNVNYIVKFGSGVSLNLLDVIRAMITQANSPMGFSVVQNGNRLLFDVNYPLVDKSASVWFSEYLGNLTSVNLSLNDPTCTDALVQGAPTMNPSSSPSFIQQVSSTVTAWNKVEQYLDNTSENDPNNLATSANDTLFNGSVGPTLQVTATDTPYVIYGRDYKIGDIVSVEVRAGVSYKDIVSGVTLTCDPSQDPVMNVIPVIGAGQDPTQSAKTINGQLVHRIMAIERKLAKRGR